MTSTTCARQRASMLVQVTADPHCTCWAPSCAGWELAGALWLVSSLEAPEQQLLER